MPRIKYQEAFGLETKRGNPNFIAKAKGAKRGKEQLFELYIHRGLSIREIGELLGCSKDRVHRTLKEYAIERRLSSKEDIYLKYLFLSSLWPPNNGQKDMGKPLIKIFLLEYIKKTRYLRNVKNPSLDSNRPDISGISDLVSLL